MNATTFDTRSGASPAAERAATALVCQDGLQPLVNQLEASYDVRAMVADWARVIDRESALPMLLDSCRELLEVVRTLREAIHHPDRPTPAITPCMVRAQAAIDAADHNRWHK